MWVIRQIYYDSQWYFYDTQCRVGGGNCDDLYNAYKQHPQYLRKRYCANLSVLQ